MYARPLTWQLNTYIIEVQLKAKARSFNQQTRKHVI